MDGNDDAFLFNYMTSSGFRPPASDQEGGSSAVDPNSMLDAFGGSDYGMAQQTPATPSMGASGMLGMMGMPNVSEQSMFPAMSLQLQQQQQQQAAAASGRLASASFPGLQGAAQGANGAAGGAGGPKVYGASLQGALSGLSAARKNPGLGAPPTTSPPSMMQTNIPSPFPITSQGAPLGQVMAIPPQLLGNPAGGGGSPIQSGGLPYGVGVGTSAAAIANMPTTRKGNGAVEAEKAQAVFRQQQAERMMRRQMADSGLSRSDAAANAAAAMASIMVDQTQYTLPMDVSFPSGPGGGSPASTDFEQLDMSLNMGSAMNGYYAQNAAQMPPPTSGTRASKSKNTGAAAAGGNKGKGPAETTGRRASKPANGTPLTSSGYSSELHTKMTVMGPVQVSSQKKPTKAAGDRAADQAAAKAGPIDLSNNPGPVTISRHINSVINHFTSSKEGYRRLLQELDDLLFVLTTEGTIIYVSPSAKRTLGYSQEELVGKPILDFCHADDATLITEELENSVQSAVDSAYHARFVKKSGEYLLMEVRGKPYGKEQLRVLGQKDNGKNGAHSVLASADELMDLPTVPGEIKFVVNTAREYRSKASLAVDGILELSVENLKLRRQLERALKEKGIDPSTHPLLKEAENELPPSMLPSELFESAGLDMRERQSFTKNEPYGAGGMNGVGEGVGPLAPLPAAGGGAGGGGDGERKKVGVTAHGRFIECHRSNIPFWFFLQKKGASEEIFCRQCGTTASPEWRRGPDGPKTLCNACGLAFAKKAKKASKAAAAAAAPPAPVKTTKGSKSARE